MPWRLTERHLSKSSSPSPLMIEAKWKTETRPADSVSAQHSREEFFVVQLCCEWLCTVFATLEEAINDIAVADVAAYDAHHLILGE